MGVLDFLAPRASRPNTFALADKSNPLTRGLVLLASGADLASNSGLPPVATTISSTQQQPTAAGIGVSAVGATRPFIADQLTFGVSDERTVLLMCVFRTSGVTRVYHNASTGAGVGYWIGQLGSNITLGSVLTSPLSPHLGRPVVVAVVNSGIQQELWVNGASAGATTSLRAVGTGMSWLSFGASSGFDVDAATGSLLLRAVWDRALSGDEIASVSADPWQLFAPQQIYVPRAAAGGGLPTLSAPTAIDITATSFRPRVTYAY